MDPTCQEAIFYKTPIRGGSFEISNGGMAWMAFSIFYVRNRSDILHDVEKHFA
jgi:c-di-GMP-binding flagellar brake protein YcgR